MSANAENDTCTRQENVLVSNRMDTSQGQVQRTKQRTVLGVLTENEQHSRSFGQGGQPSKQGSISDNSQTNLPGCPSSSSFHVYFDEVCEVVLTASGEVVASESHFLDEDAAALQHKDFRLLLELSSGSFEATSVLPDEAMTSGDILCWSEYGKDIHQHLRMSELKFRPNPGYLGAHPEITSSMRVIVVDWLMEVGLEYHLCSETLYLAVNYLDRFLSCTQSVRRGMLQLVGTAAILLAAKYEEVSPPELDELVYVTDDTYTKRQLIRMEQIILKGLAFDMTVPTAHQFLRQFMAVQSVCSQTEYLALYVAELSLLEMEPFLQYVPSMLAAAAYCLANYTVNRALWPDALCTFSGYTMVEIVPCLKDLHTLYVSAENRLQQTIREKYASSKYGRVSLLTPPAALPFS